MANSRVGHVDPFDSETSDFPLWQDRFEDYLAANDIEDEDKQRRMLTLLVGVKAHKILKNLVSPGLISDKTPKELLALLNRHFSPKLLVVAESVKFWQRSQREGESMAEYVEALRNMATSCDFGQFLERALRDRFVSGLRSEAMQRRLLGEEMDFARAVELASSMEAATRDIRELNRPKEAVSVGQIQRRGMTTAKDSQLKCDRCDGVGHDDNSCRFAQAICHQCGKKGHIARACRSDSGDSGSQSAGKKPYRTARAHQCDEDFEDDMGHLEICQTEDLPVEEEVVAKLNGRPTVMEVDRSATHSVISKTTWKRIGKPRLLQSQWQPEGFGNEPKNVIGLCNVNVTLADRSPVRLPIHVASGPSHCRIGRDWTEPLKMVNCGVTDAATHSQMGFGLDDDNPDYQEMNGFPLVMD